VSRADGASGTIVLYTTAYNRGQSAVYARVQCAWCTRTCTHGLCTASHMLNTRRLCLCLWLGARAPQIARFTSSRDQARELTVSAASLANFGIWDDQWAREKRAKLLRRTALEASREDSGGPHPLQRGGQHGFRNRTRAECSQCERVFCQQPLRDGRRGAQGPEALLRTTRRRHHDTMVSEGAGTRAPHQPFPGCCLGAFRLSTAADGSAGECEQLSN
jgi:hypothetical protein